MSERTLSVLDGSTFVLGDRLGDVRPEAGREHGFFSDDTRFTSRWVLHLDETPLELLSLEQSAHFEAQHEAAGTIASAILAAAPYFEHRLPEVFAGFPRPVTSVPVAFPTASRPQAWAAGTPLLLLTALLGLRPGDTDVEADPRTRSGTSRSGGSPIIRYYVPQQLPCDQWTISRSTHS
ncbi:MAG: glycogen debranching N-terminal domain-containing protein [Solirubrobacteraceae bacterium]